MSLIDPAHRADPGHWPDPRHRRRRDHAAFRLDPRPLPPAPLTALPSLLEPATPEPPLPALRIAFYAAHQPLATPEPPPGSRWDVSV
jgi:hypothetical protein